MKLEGARVGVQIIKEDEETRGREDERRYG
jgi:hypothetical protein